MRDYAWMAVALLVWAVCVRIWGLKIVLMGQVSLAGLVILVAIGLAITEKKGSHGRKT